MYLSIKPKPTISCTVPRRADVQWECGIGIILNIRSFAVPISMTLFHICRDLTCSPEEVGTGRKDESMCPDVLGTADEGDVDEVLLIAYVSECGDQRLVKVVPLETKLLVASAPPHDPDASVEEPIFD